MCRTSEHRVAKARLTKKVDLVGTGKYIAKMDRLRMTVGRIKDGINTSE